jgi:endoglucanase
MTREPIGHPRSGRAPRALAAAAVAFGLLAAIVACDRIGDVTVEGTTPTTSVGDTTAPTVATTAPPAPEVSAPPTGRLAVSGNQLLGPDGAPLRLIGLNRSGAEYACVQSLGIWDGSGDAAVVDAMASWGINSVRIPLNEHCWLAINEAPPEFSGTIYRDAIVAFVQLLEERGLVAILDLHWSGPGDSLAVKNMPMPNADYSVEFWRSVSETFRDKPLVVFDVFNEPHDIEWECWRDGCVMPPQYGAYLATGMQSLVDVIRAQGATQPILLSGLRYANDLTRWLEFAPEDPLDALLAGFHLYNFNQCITVECWDETVAPVAASVPVITAELGENTCEGGFIQQFMDWADARGVSYLGWTFNTWDCNRGPAMIVDEAGTPTPFGQVFRDHVLGLGVQRVEVPG